MSSLIQICEASEGWTTVDVPSHSDPDKSYTCVILGPGDYDDVLCECPGFIHRGECSHQKEAVELLCDWEEGKTPEQTNKQRWDHTCPRCFGPTMLVEA